jgi:hypothetical protein
MSPRLAQQWRLFSWQRGTASTTSRSGLDTIAMTEIVFPGTFAQALSSDLILPGSRVLLHAGTYSGDFINALEGTAESPITIMSYPGERAKIDGGLDAGGSYVTFKDLEIMWSGWANRTSNVNTKTMIGSGTYLKFINCVIHDLSGPYFPTTMLGLEIYGCVVYHTGWSGVDRGHGHGLYIQNNTPTKTIKDNIVFDTFGWGIHVYTENGLINNITLEGNTCFKNGSLYNTAYNPILYGGGAVADNPILRANMTYGAGNNLGYSAGCTNAVLEDNYFPNGLTKTEAQIDTETGNYYGPAVGNEVFLRANTYDANRANLTIYNQAAANTIDVDVSSLFGASGTVKAYNVQDYFVDIQTLTVTSGVITVNMQAVNRTVATPVGWTAPAKTFPQFGAFILVKQ